MLSESQIVEQLLAKGLDADEATALAKGFRGGDDSNDVDVDRLTEAMEGIRKSFEHDSSDIDAVVQEANDIVDAVTKGADALLEEHRGQFDALSKALLLLTEEVKELRSSVGVGSETVRKSLVQTEEPMRKSIAVDEVPAPGEHVETDFHPSSWISKAISEIRTTESDTRKSELRKAITLLESGLPADQVVSTYSLK